MVDSIGFLEQCTIAIVLMTAVNQRRRFHFNKYRLTGRWRDHYSRDMNHSALANQPRLVLTLAGLDG